MRIEVEVRNVYGCDRIYPANEAAKNLAEIAGKTTLAWRELEIAQRLGHEVAEVHGNKLPALVAKGVVL